MASIVIITLCEKLEVSQGNNFSKFKILEMSLNENVNMINWYLSIEA